ncbi:hypothetical protein T4D_4962 [Trichinella pseudospiralis]|uniref:Uncharacterized protein n=1 Tax=Trichinella pseudospiralis TaxID=6337 RepID=A0A0V1FG45_TRIPS|nr:hypothetical protein T4D_4962 [Trichinella pseudospiralis]
MEQCVGLCTVIQNELKPLHGDRMKSASCQYKMKISLLIIRLFHSKSKKANSQTYQSIQQHEYILI